MVTLRTFCFHNTVELIEGMKREFHAGLRPRALLFMGFDEHGTVHIAVAEREAEVSTLTVGAKLTLSFPFTKPLLYVDAIHPLGNGVVVINGDRRLEQVANLVDVIGLVSEFVKQAVAHASSAARLGFQLRAQQDSIFFGCTPHQPGSWWLTDDRNILPVHTHGYLEIVPTPRGLVARRTVDKKLYFLAGHHAVEGRYHEWQPVYESPLGNILMLERRWLAGRLFLSCQRGLIELDLTDLPNVHELDRLEIAGGFAVIARVSHGTFAVTHGTAQEWGFDGMRPATLVGTREGSLAELEPVLETWTWPDPSL